MDPDEQNTVGLEDFLNSVVGFVQGSKTNRYLK
jgi:hypothetical protein